MLCSSQCCCSLLLLFVAVVTLLMCTTLNGSNGREVTRPLEFSGLDTWQTEPTELWISQRNQSGIMVHKALQLASCFTIWFAAGVFIDIITPLLLAIMPLVATLTTAQLAVGLLMTYGMYWLIWPWRRFKTDARPSSQTTEQLLPAIALMHGIHLACTIHCYGPLKCDLQVRETAR
jgi:hypothetical protein